MPTKVKYYDDDTIDYESDCDDESDSEDDIPNEYTYR